MIVLILFIIKVIMLVLKMLMFIILPLTMLTFKDIKHLVLGILLHMLMPKKKIVDLSTRPHTPFKTFDASYVLANKSGKIVAKYVGSRHKSPKTCIWFPKVLVSNTKGLKDCLST
jgi:hypothetical protein